MGRTKHQVLEGINLYVTLVHSREADSVAELPDDPMTVAPT